MTSMTVYSADWRGRRSASRWRERGRSRRTWSIRSRRRTLRPWRDELLRLGSSLHCPLRPMRGFPTWTRTWEAVTLWAVEMSCVFWSTAIGWSSIAGLVDFVGRRHYRLGSICSTWASNVPVWSIWDRWRMWCCWASTEQIRFVYRRWRAIDLFSFSLHLLLAF